MNNENSCKFDEELVSYLYGEMSGPDKESFEVHLKGCNSCMAELDDLSLAHSSVLEFKSVKFDHLQTPVIEIEYDKTRFVPKSNTEAQTESASKPWFAAVRDLFTLSPSWATAATAFGALALTFGIFYFAVNSNDKDVVQDTSPKASPSVSPKTESNVGTNYSQEPGNELVQNTKPTPTPPVKTGAAQKNLVDSGDQPAVPVKASVTNVPKKKASKGTTDDNKSVKPKALDKPSKALPKQKDVAIPDTDDEEDDTLRLADMFEEITAKNTK